jgi:hypothetical protein
VPIAANLTGKVTMASETIAAPVAAIAVPQAFAAKAAVSGMAGVE